MCPHDSFEIVSYDHWEDILIRKCTKCGQLEIRIGSWTGAASLQSLLDKLLDSRKEAS